MKPNQLLSALFGNPVSDAGSRVSLVCPEGQTVSVEVSPSADDACQLILCSCDLHLLIAVRLALCRRLEVSLQTSYLFHITSCMIFSNKTFSVNICSITLYCFVSQ